MAPAFASPSQEGISRVGASAIGRFRPTVNRTAAAIRIWPIPFLRSRHRHRRRLKLIGASAAFSTQSRHPVMPAGLVYGGVFGNLVEGVVDLGSCYPHRGGQQAALADASRLAVTTPDRGR
jgi:hypothetical protein